MTERVKSAQEDIGSSDKYASYVQEGRKEHAYIQDIHRK